VEAARVRVGGGSAVRVDSLLSVREGSNVTSQGGRVWSVCTWANALTATSSNRFSSSSTVPTFSSTGAPMIALSVLACLAHCRRCSWRRAAAEVTKLLLLLRRLRCVATTRRSRGSTPAARRKQLRSGRIADSVTDATESATQLCLTIRANNHDFDMQSLEGVTLPRTVAVRRLQ
jgi:hypothetical protein